MRISRCTTYVLLRQAYCGLQLCRYLHTIIVYNIYNRKKTPVYHTVNGNCALFHTSKTAKMIKVILLGATFQNANVLLSNITFIIFAIFDV